MKINLIRLPFLIPPWALAQVLLPNTIFWRKQEGHDSVSTHVLAHELGHVVQIQGMGLLRYWFEYVRDLIRYGYNDHPMERWAERMAYETEFHGAAWVLWENLASNPNRWFIRINLDAYGRSL